MVLVLWVLGYTGIRVGEASNPGPEHCLTVSSINVTSLPAQVDVVKHLRGDVVALQETRLNETSQGEMQREMDSAGWQLICGKPQPRQERKKSSPSPWNAKHGGVAVIAKKGLVARRQPADTAAKQRLWQTGRWVHVAISTGEGHVVLHVMSVYGWTGAEQKFDAMVANEQLLRDVFEVAAELGDVPVIVAGDFNVHLERSSQLTSALATGIWHDAARLLASARGAEPAATCFKNSTSTGTRIDMIFCNESVAASIRDCWVDVDAGLPTHRPVIAELDMKAYEQRVRRVIRPRSFPTAEWAECESEVEEDMALEELLRLEEKWQMALHDMDVDTLWSTWCAAAEAYFIRRSEGKVAEEDANLYRGRGRTRRTRTLAVSAYQDPQVGDAISLRQRQLQKLMRQIDEFCRQRARLSQFGPAVGPWELRRLWVQIQSRVARWVPALQHGALICGTSLPSLEQALGL